MSAVYAHADKALKRLYARAEAEFQNLAVTAKWDELRIVGTLQTVNALYERLNEACEDEYLFIAKHAYRDVRKETDTREPDELFIFALISAYDQKMQYRYDREWQRKRDRLAESLIAVTQAADARLNNGNEVRQALKRALTLMEKQMQDMAETVTDEARIRAFDDMGIEKVKWNDMSDGKVCAQCAARDGQVYFLHDVPVKHRHCRCFLTPAEG